jgi:hypothetical protein
VQPLLHRFPDAIGGAPPQAQGQRWRGPEVAACLPGGWPWAWSFVAGIEDGEGPGELQRPPEPEQQLASRLQLPQAAAQQQLRQEAWRRWVEQAAAEGPLAIDLLQTADQQPLPQAEGSSRGGCAAPIRWGGGDLHHPAAAEQGAHRHAQPLSIGGLKQARHRQIEQETGGIGG